MSTDRNQKAREEFEAARVRQARKEFRAAAEAGQVGVRDRFGRAIQVGHQIAYSSSIPLIADVIDVGPDMRLNAQPGVMRLVLAIPVELYVVANQAQPAMIVTAIKAPAGAEQDAAEPPAEPPVAEPPDEVAPAAEGKEPTNG